MKGPYASAIDRSEKLLLTALVLSLLIHLLSFGLWKLGKSMGWWRHVELPRWMQLVRKTNLTPVAKKISPPLQPSEAPPLVFVDVDPALAVAEPPKDAKFYSSANSLASNPNKTTPSDVPQINGRQDKVVKTTEASKPKAQPLQPSRPVPEKAQVAEAKPLPKKSETPGDMAMAKPKDKPVEKTGPSETQAAEALEPVPKPARPRTLAEVAQHQGLAGEKMRQEGGVARMGIDSSLDVRQTAWGDYDRDFIDAVQTRWYQLLVDRQATAPGKVVVEFKLHPDGRITDMKMTLNEVSDLLGIICQQAVLDPAPFKPWPQKMRQELTDPRDVRFTFYYYNE